MSRKVINVIANQSPISFYSLDYGETKTVNLTVETYDTKIMLLSIKPGGIFDLNVDLGEDGPGGAIELYIQRLSDSSDISIKINGETIPDEVDFLRKSLYSSEFYTLNLIE